MSELIFEKSVITKLQSKSETDQKVIPEANTSYNEEYLTTQNIQNILLHPLDLFRNTQTIPECLHFLEKKKISKVVLIVLDSSLDDLRHNADKFKFFTQNCKFDLPYRRSNAEDKSFIEELKSYNTGYSETPEKDGTYSRLTLLMNRLDMFESAYPTDNPTYTHLLDIYAPVTTTSSMFAIDTERVTTTNGSEMARISIVDEDLLVVYDEYVKPSGYIIDYLTLHSGIPLGKLTDVTKTLAHVQKEIKNILPSDAILLGHSLNMDLDALKLWHPYCIDTSVIYNLPKHRQTSKLNVLAATILGMTIQAGYEGHDSVENCKGIMALVQKKLQKFYSFYKNDSPIPRSNCANDFFGLLNQLQNRCFHYYNCFKKEGIYYYNFFTIIKGRPHYFQCIHQPHLGPKYHIVEFKRIDEDDFYSSVDEQMEAFYNTCPKNTLFLVILPGDDTKEGLFCGTLKG